MKILNINKLNMATPKFENLENAFIPSEIYIPLAENQNKLKIGKKIKEGEVLSFLDGANFHSSIPGVLSEIRKQTMPNGKINEVAVVKMGGAFSYVGHKILKSEWKLFSSSQVLTLLTENGVHNTFFGYCGISSLVENVDIEKENILGVRLFDYDPSCVTDSFLFEKYTDEIVEGACILAKSINATKIIFFYNREQKEIVDEIDASEYAESYDFQFEKLYSNKFSYGTKEELNSVLKKQDISADGFVDSFTCYAAYEAVALCKPVVDTFVHISGSILGEEKIFKVKRGTPLKSLIEECGFCKSAPNKVVVNGMLKGCAINDSNIPITDYVKSVTLLSSREVSSQVQYACIRCGDCFRACNEGIKPNYLFAMYHFNSDIPAEYKEIASKCTRCGRCNTVCPSRLPLYQTISLICEEEYEK